MLLVFFFSIAYLVYRAFQKSNPGNQARTLTLSFVLAVGCTPVWLLISSFVVSLANCVFAPLASHVVTTPETRSCKPCQHQKHAMAYTTALGGCMWTSMYLLWVLGPILINPLKNDYSSGTNNLSQADLLTASTRADAAPLAPCIYLLCTPTALKVLETIGKSLIGIEKHITTMLNSSSKVTTGRTLAEMGKQA